MSEKNTVVIVSGVRTAVGRFGGGLSTVKPSELGAKVIAEAVKRAGLSTEQVQQTFLGQVIPNEPRDAYIARVAAVEAGIPHSAPALTVNRLCGSGLQAIVSATQSIMLGDCDIAVAGGAENMSSAPYVMPAVRWGQKMGDAPVLDCVTAALEDPFGNGHMGITAENVAKQFGIGREEQDVFANESHRRASHAIAEGRFVDQILPIEITVRRKQQIIDTDEHVRSEVTIDDLAGMRPAFDRDGTVTPGNASGINDGAGAIVLMSEKTAAEQGVKPMARVLSYGLAGVDPAIMGMGPVDAVKQALQRARITVDDLDVIESNEAFAVQACAVAKELGFPADKTNPNGGAVALGHPVGATGAVITVKALYELQRIGGRYGLITLCIGGGQGIAMVIEAV
ncbi:MAG: beta-ketothiolase BktB [Rhodospirillales bacterium]|jgi:acetyl-CoA C-acetyltransferase|nr:beta-ketothiolase BktB [Rhodospirillales bacterium]